MIENLLWRIDGGLVRTFTLQEEGTLITLGLWGAGDTVGQPLAGVAPYQIECLSPVQAHRLQTEDYQDLGQVMWDHIHQSQILQSIRHGPMYDRLQQFLTWFAHKFGTRSENEWRIPNRLTQQDLAEAIGTTRVTVCRLMGELEHNGVIRWSQQSCLLRASPHSPD